VGVVGAQREISIESTAIGKVSLEKRSKADTGNQSSAYKRRPSRLKISQKEEENVCKKMGRFFRALPSLGER